MFSKSTLITPEVTPIDNQTDYNLNEVKSLVRLGCTSLYRMSRESDYQQYHVT